MNTAENYNNIKAAVLSGMSGYAAAKKYGVDPLSVAKRLSIDPDIVKAKADGTVKSRAKRHKTTTHYLNLDYVKAVMEDGMTQTASAAKFGKAQAQVAFGVKKAREELVAMGVPTPDVKPPTPTTSSPAPTPTHSPEAQTLATTLKLLAASSGKSPKALWDEVAEAL